MTTKISQTEILKFLEDYILFLRDYPNGAIYEVPGYFLLGRYLLSSWSDPSLNEGQRDSLRKAIERCLNRIDVKIEVI